MANTGRKETVISWARILRHPGLCATRNKGVGRRDPWLWVHALSLGVALVVAGGLARMVGWLVIISTQSHTGEGLEVVGLMVGKAQEWALFMRHRVTLGHQQQAAILYLWSNTFPESGNLSPVRGRFGAAGAS